MNFREDKNVFKRVVAPMVGYSELAWRMMMRSHGATLCYTPMINSRIFVETKGCISHEFETDTFDRPLAVQFGSNDPDIFTEAGKLVQDCCDFVDLNLGCPQDIARKGHYGCFLQDEWDLIYSMVRQSSQILNVPISCKMRIFPSLKKSIAYAQMLESAGCSLLSVHGRTRDLKGQNSGAANLEYIKEIKNNLKIPVICNGNVCSFSDLNKCIDLTGCDGVMCAESVLSNPYLFESDENKCCYSATYEYLTYARRYNTKFYYVKGHLFKLLHHALEKHTQFRPLVGSCNNIDSAENLVNLIKDNCDQNCFAPNNFHALCHAKIRKDFILPPNYYKD